MTTRWQLTRAGAGALAISIVMLVAGVIKTINLLILFGVLLLAIVMLNAFLAWRSLRNAHPVRCPQSDHFAGVPTARCLGFRKDCSTASAVVMKESSAVHSCQAFSALVPPGPAVMIRVPMTPRYRGAFPLRTTLASGYPFGFVSVEHSTNESDSLYVFPSLGAIDENRLRRWLIRTGTGDARRPRPHLLQSASVHDLRGVRPYRNSDSPRLIHWRSTARRNELLVREYDSPMAIDLLLVVESWLPPTPRHEDHQRLESAISLAATLLANWCHAEQSPRITLVTADTETITGTASPHLARAFFKRLAEIPGGSTFDFHWNSRGSSSPRAVQVLVSSRPESGSLPGLLVQRCGGVWQRIAPPHWPAWYHPPMTKD